MRRALIALLAAPALALAADAEYALTIKDHRFSPAEIRIPAGKKVRINIDNRDATPEEFHSDDLNREKVILGNGKGVVHIGPLKPGKYSFMGEFHAETAKGVVIAE